jgi:FkbM family methyltransferase
MEWTMGNRGDEWWVWTGGWYELDGETNYLTNWPELDADSLIVDIGAYEGKLIKTLVEKYGCKAYGFEPSPRAFKVMTARLQEHKRAILFPCAVGEKSETVCLYDCERDGATLLEEREPHCNVEMVSYEGLCKTIDLSHVDLMAINIEGYEHKLIPHMMDIGAMTTIKHLMIQWHGMTTEILQAQRKLQARIAETHEMIWNLGAWEAWRVK